MNFKEKLNGWQRLGVVLSVVWLISVNALLVFEVIDGKKFKEINDPWAVVPTHQHFFSWKPIKLSAEEFLGSEKDHQVSGWHSEFRIGMYVAYLLVPIVCGWLVSCLTVFTIRWVYAGFKSSG